MCQIYLKYSTDFKRYWIPGSVIPNRYCMLNYDGDTPVYHLLIKVRTTQLPSYEDYAEVCAFLQWGVGGLWGIGGYDSSAIVRHSDEP